MITLYYGPVINPHTFIHYHALPRCLIAVGSDGNIIWIEDDIDPSVVHDTIISARDLKEDDYTLVNLNEKPGEFIMPGLIDTHVVRRLISSLFTPHVAKPPHAARMPVPQLRHVRIDHAYIGTDRAYLIVSGGDLELGEWLRKYVFPVERKFECNAYAERVYNDVVDRSIASGVRIHLCTIHIGAHGQSLADNNELLLWQLAP